MTDDPVDTDVDSPTSNGWTRREMKDLQEAMRLSFGSCNCMVLMTSKSMCDGHRFLSEMDLILDRPMHLLHMRRDIERFRLAEFTGKCTECGEDDQLHDIDRWDLDDGGQRVCMFCIHQRHLAEISERIDRGDAPPPATLPW